MVFYIAELSAIVDLYILLLADDLYRYRKYGVDGGEVIFLRSQQYCKCFLTGHTTTVSPNEWLVDARVRICACTSCVQYRVTPTHEPFHQTYIGLWWHHHLNVSVALIWNLADIPITDNDKYLPIPIANRSNTKNFVQIFYFSVHNFPANFLHKRSKSLVTYWYIFCNVADSWYQYFV